MTKPVQLFPELRNRLCWSFYPEGVKLTAYQQSVLSVINKAVMSSEDSEQLRTKLTEASEQCREAIRMMDETLGITKPGTVIMDKRKAS
jgi:hypothetical protein